MAEPLSRCGACGQTDDHPKHQVFLGPAKLAADGSSVYHEHDFDHTNTIYYHFDCPSVWHDKVDDQTKAHIAKVGALAASGVHGDDLRSRIVGGDI